MTPSSLEALARLRDGGHMQWYVVPLLIFVVYVYVTEIERRNWDLVYLGVAFLAAELIWEMFNGLVLHFSQYAPLWSAPGRSAYLIYVGLNIEIAFFFAVSAVLVIKCLPKDERLKIFGVSNRVLVPLVMGLLAVLVEILLNRCGLLVWDYWWWSWPHVYLIVVAYCLPWWLLVRAHDKLSSATKKRLAQALPVAAATLHVLFGSILKWV